jgi:hypothetical protein
MPGFQPAPAAIRESASRPFLRTASAAGRGRVGAGCQSVKKAMGYLLRLDREGETDPSGEPLPRVHLKASAGKLFCSGWKLPGK